MAVLLAAIAAAGCVSGGGGGDDVPGLQEGVRAELEEDYYTSRGVVRWPPR